MEATERRSSPSVQASTEEKKRDAIYIYIISPSSFTHKTTEWVYMNESADIYIYIYTSAITL